ncbi:hypothetical protein [Pseudoalteromonas luteoviolacea]|nr:hypothetical protein [Pseudoalteromonas luteoviolacea]
MTESAFSIEFKKNTPDHTMIVVFFLCLWFALFLLLPNFWWLSIVLCYIGFLDAKKRLYEITPDSGIVLIQEGQTWLQLTGAGLDMQGDILSAHRYANWLVLSVQTDEGVKRVTFLASAMDKVSWSHFNRIVLANR